MKTISQLKGSISWPSLLVLGGSASGPVSFPPSQFGELDWRVDPAGQGEIAITVINVPVDNGSAITAIQIRIDGGAWASIGFTTAGSVTLTGYTSGAHDVEIRAVNSINPGLSALKAVTVTAAPVAPNAITSAQWTLTPLTTAGGNQLRINITALPFDGGSALTGLQFRVDSGSGYGSWQNLSGGATTGVRDITVLAETPAAVQVRAVNAVDPAQESDTKTETPVRAATVPAAFASGDVSVTPGGHGEIVIAITGLPYDGGSPLTDIQRRLDGDAWVSVGFAGLGSITLTGIAEGLHTVETRAVNAIGESSELAKQVTVTAPDTTAPVISNASFDDNTDTATFTLSEPGALYWAIFSDADGTPALQANGTWTGTTQETGSETVANSGSGDLTPSYSTTTGDRLAYGIIDGGGNVSNVIVETITLAAAPATRPWIPADAVTTPALWTKSSDAASLTLDGTGVSQWSDKSGNGRHLVQSNAAVRPQYNPNHPDWSAPVVEMSSGDLWEAIPAFQRRYMIIVARYNGGAGVFGTYEIFDNTQGGEPRGAPRVIGYLGSGRFFNGAAPTNWRTNGGAEVTSGDVLPLDKDMLGMEYDLSGPAELFCNATLIDRTLRAQFAEIIILSDVPSEADRQRYEGYLAHENGLAAKLPASHPYKTSPPMVTIGSGGPTAAPVLSFVTASEQNADLYGGTLETLAAALPAAGDYVVAVHSLSASHGETMDFSVTGDNATEVARLVDTSGAANIHGSTSIHIVRATAASSLIVTQANPQATGNSIVRYVQVYSSDIPLSATAISASATEQDEADGDDLTITATLSAVPANHTVVAALTDREGFATQTTWSGGFTTGASDDGFNRGGFHYYSAKSQAGVPSGDFTVTATQNLDQTAVNRKYSLAAVAVKGA